VAGIQRLRTLAQAVVANAGPTEVNLPRDTVYRGLILMFTFNYDVGVAAATLHEDGLSAFLSRLQLLATGMPSLFDMDGFTAKTLAQYECGSALTADLAPVGVAAAQVGRLFVPINFELRDAVNPYTTLFDARGLPEFKLRIDSAAFSGSALTAGGGGSVTFNSCQLDVLADVWDTDRAIAGQVLERRSVAVTALQTTTGARAQQQFDLLTGGLFRGGLLIARTAAPNGGTRTDARPTAVSIRRNTADRIVDSAPWRLLKERMFQDQTDNAPATGVAYLSLDPEGAMQNDALLQGTRIADFQETLVLETEIATANVHWTFVPQMLVARGQ
jgi:hypothetical protein